MPLIDRDALKKQMCKICNENYSDDPCEPNDCVFLNAIDSAPTIDAVPVVRCKDCKFWKKGNFQGGNSLDRMEWGGGCPLVHFVRYESDFCSKGERRSDD